MIRSTTWVSLTLCAASALIAQQPAASPGVRRVALAPDTCPSVRPGDTVTLDWNPGFAPAWPVQDLGGYTLRLRQSRTETQGALGPLLQLRAPFPLVPAVPGPNGFFHLELKVTGDLPPSGQYFVTEMTTQPHLAADFHGEAPAMTNSPAAGRLCVNFEHPPRVVTTVSQ